MIKKGKRYDKHAGPNHLSDEEIIELSENEVNSREYENALTYDEVKQKIKESFGEDKKVGEFMTSDRARNQDLLEDFDSSADLGSENISDSQARSLKDVIADKKTTDEERAFIFNVMFDLKNLSGQDEWNEEIVRINKEWSDQIKSAQNEWAGVEKSKLPFFMDQNNPISLEEGHTILMKAVRYVEHDPV